MGTWGLPMVLCAIAALADVIGGMLTVLRKLSPRQTVLVTALGCGFLLGATVLDRLPDAMEELPGAAPLWILAGYLGMLLLDRSAGRAPAPNQVLVPAREGASDGHGHLHAEMLSQRAGLAVLAGMLVHTLMDGIVIAGAFQVSRSAGVLMFLAITLHKLPEGFSMATVALAAGETRWRAFTSSALLAVSTLAGAALTLWLGQADAAAVHVVMAVATGSFLFISTTGLIPGVRNSGERMAPYIVVAGVLFFLVSLYLVRAVGLQ
ncbi:ZIP family metal transporter [Alicyclobacillus macrosporangiidus]|uniref:Zinc transporter, ZIP family n=1 Tax=Alicyclobacillus macrosporangiidus TaxID=392015 RepID=A0A1I7IGV5_9BACL|nr:ZIP family metal transporter [Alicyclobacillus macrosporangiidus]SFU72126.1 zinc transporter, ZIP family [Alicyclobacillus macrosporangiidus]